MDTKKEKSIRLKLTGDDVARFDAAKQKAEKSSGVKLTDTAFLRGVIKLRIE